jgi:hypothetical protein
VESDARRPASGRAARSPRGSRRAAARRPARPRSFHCDPNNNLADVKAVLAQGAKTEAPNWLGFTPLMWAAVLGNEPACEALITAGANVNAPSRFGNVLAYAE